MWFHQQTCLGPSRRSCRFVKNDVQIPVFATDGSFCSIAAALETAKLIASKSPIAVVGTKHLLAHARDHT